MDAVRLFSCHFFGQGEQLAGTHSWQGAGRSVTSESCLAGSALRAGGAGGGTAMRMDGWMDGQAQGRMHHCKDCVSQWWLVT